jgi:hypothetical protein
MSARLLAFGVISAALFGCSSPGATASSPPAAPRTSTFSGQGQGRTAPFHLTGGTYTFLYSVSGTCNYGITLTSTTDSTNQLSVVPLTDGLPGTGSAGHT